MGPTGPTGPCCTGPAGPTGPGPGTTGQNTEKWSGLFALPLAIALPPATADGPGTSVFSCTYLADAAVTGLRFGVEGVGLVNIAPNYPAPPEGVTWTSLAATLKSVTGVAIITPLTLPPNVEIAVELVRNAGQADEAVCLAVVFDAVGSIVIPVAGVGEPLQDAVEGPCLIAPGETYDVRVCLQNPTATPITFTLAADASILVAVTATS